MHGVVQYDVSPIKGPLLNAFVILINALFFNVKFIGLYDVYPRDYSQKLLDERETVFDFIIVGAGAAGCAAANRITDVGQWSVLLIEAGDYPSSSTDVPGFYPTFVGSREDWQFYLEKDQRACVGFIGERCMITRGKVLGGTSTINNMMYVRGLLDDYDKLAIDAWDGNLTHEVFRKIERFQTNHPEPMQYEYGKEGEVYLNLLNFTDDIKFLLQNTYRNSGYNRIPKKKYIGFTEQLLMIENGERINMAKAFLTPVKDRPNLYFTKNTEVEAVAVASLDDKAYGVNVSIDGARFLIRAKKEVILTAGPINNAKLLMLSGIGPRDYLLKRKLPFVTDLPGVGKNLQFHLTVPIYVSIQACPRDVYHEIDLIKDTYDYIMHRHGNLSHTNINEFVQYIRTTKNYATSPNLVIYHSYFKIGDHALKAWAEGMNYHPKIMNKLLTLNSQRAIILFLVTLIHPESRGNIFLNDTYYLGNPSIRGNFQSDDENVDYQTLLSGFNYVTNLTEDYAMRQYNATILDLDIPNCRNNNFCTLPYVKCYIYNMAFPNSDLAGSTKMGPECDTMAVVKDNLEVKRIRCLRVADSSVMNSITVGNTVATDAMIGCNLAEILKEKWLKDYVSPFLYHKHDHDAD